MVFKATVVQVRNMSGAIPSSNYQSWLAHAEHVPISKSAHQNKDSFSVRAAYQRGERALCTNISTDYQFSLPSTSKVTQTTVLKALQPRDTLSIRHQSIRNNCSEACIELLMRGSWALNPEFYENNQQIDIVMGLCLAGEISSQIHAENPARQGVLISYDGYSESKFTQFIKNKLNITQCYIVRTGNIDVIGRHYAVSYFDSLKGWIVEDKLLGLNQLTDARGSLTAFGRELLAPYADWGPYNEQHSIVFIEVTPRRIAILSEYLLRYRYYGEVAAGMAMQEFNANMGAFSERPAHAKSFMFPSPLRVPFDEKAMQYAAVVASISASKSKYFVPYMNASVEQALMVLAVKQTKFNTKCQMASNINPIDLVRALVKANELDPEGVFNAKEEKDDCYVDVPYYISSRLQKLNKAKPFFLRIGINSAPGHYLALKYFNETPAYPSGWYYYGKQNEMQSSTQDQSTEWILLADNKGLLTLEGNQICHPNIIWGKEANRFSLQFIEATEARQRVLQNYISCFRQVSAEAAFAVLDQHAQARIREIAEDELKAEQIAIDPQSVKFSSLLAQFNAEDLLDDLSTIIGREAIAKQPIPASTGEALVDLEIRKHIAHLYNAQENKNESLLNRVKFMAVRMLLQNVEFNQIIRACRKYWIEEGGGGGLFLTEDKLPSVSDFYLKGGLLLLRGLSITSRPALYSAKVMKAAIDVLEKNKTLGARNLLDILEEKIKNNLVLGISLEDLPVSPALNTFIKRCGYLRQSGENRYGDWSFNPNLTANIPSENLPTQIFDLIEPQPKTKVARKAKKRK